MQPTPRNRRHLAAALLALAAVVAACGGTSTPSASAGAASAVVSPSAAGAAGSGAALLDVKVNAPYSLSDLPASKADSIQASIDKDLGAYGKTVHATVKEIQQGATTAAYLMVVYFPQGTLNDKVYADALTSLSMGAESDFTPKLISNVPVSFGSLNGGSVAAFRAGDLILIALSPGATDLTPVVTALVQANG